MTRPEQLIDFRARPNTMPFMSIYDGSSSRNPWQKFRTQRPETGSLDEYVSHLREVGVMSGVFTGRQGVLAGNHPISNDYIADAVRSNPGVIFGMGGIDPRDTDSALKEMDRVIGDLGLSGFAFDPPSPIDGEGPSWDSEEFMFPLYQRAVKLEVPIVLTMGPVVGRHGRPEAVDRIAATFPTLRVVCSHGVWPQTMDLIGLAFRRPNVYLEASIYFSYPGAAPLIAEAANKIVPDQIVYASAYPFMPLETIDEFSQIGLGDEALDRVCYQNADRLLGAARLKEKTNG